MRKAKLAARVKEAQRAALASQTGSLTPPEEVADDSWAAPLQEWESPEEPSESGTLFIPTEPGNLDALLERAQLPLPARFIGGCVNGCKAPLAQGDAAILHCHWLAPLTVTS